MAGNRNILLAGVGLVAFALFLIFGWVGGHDGRRGGEGAKIAGAASGGKGGQDASLGRDESRGRTLVVKKRPIGGKKKRADPKLVKKLKVPGKRFMATGPPVSPKDGIVKQSFTGDPTLIAGGAGGATPQSGGSGGEIAAASAEGEASADAGAEDSANPSCPDCGAPFVTTMVVDILTQPIFESAFDATCSGPFFMGGHGEGFEIGGDPACVTFFPTTCRGSGVALLDERFFVTVRGECIPDRNFLKNILAR